MKLKFILSTMLITLSLSAFSSESLSINHSNDNYTDNVESIITGQENSIYQNNNVNKNISEGCISHAPDKFLNKYKSIWQSALKTKITDFMFLSENLQTFRRIAIYSCIESAFHTKNGNGDEFLTAIRNQIALQKQKATNNAYEQTKFFELEAGLYVAEYEHDILSEKIS